MQHKIKMLLLSLCISHSVWGDLTVIADFGGESAVRFYEALQPEHDENAPNYRILFQLRLAKLIFYL